MKLSIAERLQLPILYPEKGDHITLTLKADIIKKVSMSQEEIAEVGLKTEDGKVFSWDPAKATEKEIDFSDSELELLRKKLKELDDRKELDDLTHQFYKKFLT